jgi:hypothetical protein
MPFGGPLAGTVGVAAGGAGVCDGTAVAAAVAVAAGNEVTGGVGVAGSSVDVGVGLGAGGCTPWFTGQMVSPASATHRCSLSAWLIAAFSEALMSKPLEPLPPAHAASTQPKSNQVHRKCRRMIASLRTSSTSPAR